MDDAVGTIASHGVLGALVVVLGFACWRLYVALQESNAARVKDAQETAKFMAGENDKWSRIINELTAAVRDLRAEISRRAP